jgi:hypothetical protein
MKQASKQAFKLHISTGNTKLGKVANISLLPGATCSPDVPCKQVCYARKFLRGYRPALNTAWRDNTSYAKQASDEYFNEIHTWIDKHKPKYFRWHVAGDIPSQNYLEDMIVTAMMFENVRFLCFTKRHELDFSRVPKNLKVIFSMWPKWDLDPQAIRSKPGISAIAWMQDGSETRYPLDALHCKGTCQQCFSCWHASKDVVFKRH